MIKRSIQHLKANKMTYLEHMFFAMFYGFLCIIAGFSLILHSLLPCFLQNTGANLVKKMNKRFNKNVGI